MNHIISSISFPLNQNKQLEGIFYILMISILLVYGYKVLNYIKSVSNNT
jgi:hypothetical protein